MKKKLLIVALISTMLLCFLAISVGATDTDPNADYYDKVYISANGTEMALYEKVGDTYYPLVWFAYDVYEADGTTVKETKYVKVHFEDVTAYSFEPGQGRFNGVYYEYTDDDGNTVVLDTENAVLINMRGGVMTKTMRIDGSYKSTDVVIKTMETTKGGYPAFSKIEAIYFPLTQTSIGSLKYSHLRVVDIDKNHKTGITMATQCLQGSGIKEFFIPASANFGGGNSQLKLCKSLETVVFGEGFNQNIPNYFLDGCSSLKRVYFMGSKSTLEGMQVGLYNSPYNSLTRISLDDYLKLSKDELDTGKYLVYDVTACYLYNNNEHTLDEVNACVSVCSVCEKTFVNHTEKENLSVSISYGSYGKAGERDVACLNEGCGYEATESAPALFYTDGFSTPENGRGDIAVLFVINYDAIAEYEKANTKSLSFGVFAILYNNIGENGILNNEKAITAEVKDEEKLYVSFEMRISGFETDEQKEAQLAIGAYVLDEKDNVSYIQAVDPDEGKEFTSVSYNDIYNQPTVEA